MNSNVDVGFRSSDEYSDGETSDDLAIKPSHSSGNSSYDNQSLFQMLTHQGLSELLSKIDPSLAEKSVPSHLAELTDQDYYIDQMNKPFLYLNSSVMEPTQSVIFITAKPYNFPNIQSEYLKEKPVLFGWTDIGQMQASDIPMAIQSCYKPLYFELRSRISFNYLLGPNKQKYDSIPSIRKECSKGRQMFHFIGYGFPEINEKGVPLCPYSEENDNRITYDSLFNLVHPPSFFLFDCNNASICLKYLKRSAENYALTHAKQTGMDNNNIQNDWFCFCATDIAEDLPMNPYLPKDFLSICLLSPVCLAVLCHILSFYKTSFPSPNFPINIINELLNSQNQKEKDDLQSLLRAITDAIAADNLQPFMFKQLFRRDRMISLLFQHFILAEHLLHQYGIHPRSYPSLPPMATHTLWNSFDMELSIWVSSRIATNKISVKQNMFSSGFFTRSINTFESEMETDSISHVSLALMCHAPFSQTPETKKATMLLARFAANSQENRLSLSKVAVFHAFFAKLVSNIDVDEFHAFCYIVVALLQSDPNSVFNIRHDLDISRLPQALFNRSLPCDTRSLVAAILAAVLDTVKAVEAFCSTPDFFQKLTQELPVASSQLQMWLLILVKRVFGSFPAIPSVFAPSGAHLQICIALFHKAPEVRAAAISSLPAFIGEPKSTRSILLLTSFLVFDMSFVVRYEFAQFLLRFIEYQGLSFGLKANTLPIANTITSCNQAILGKKVVRPNTANGFQMMVKVADGLCNADYCEERIAGIISFLADMLQRDPHPSVKQAGIKIASMIHNKGEYVEGDSDALFNISLRQLVNTGQWKSQEYKEDDKQFVPQTQAKMDDIPACSVHLLNRVRIPDLSPSKLLYDQELYKLTVAAPSKMVLRLDENLSQFAKLSFTDYDVTDLKSIYRKEQDETLLFLASSDGCVNIWSSNRHECSSSFRASISNQNGYVPQFVSPSRFYPHLATSNANGGIILWDYNYSSMISEWNGAGSTITALETLSYDDTTIVCAHDDASLSIIDTRDPFHFKIQNPSLSSQKIIHISSASYEKVTFQTISSNGIFAQWDARTGSCFKTEIIGSSVDCCDIHPSFPLIISCAKNSSPKISSTSGKTLYPFSDIKNVTDLAFHPKLPIFACATASGEIYSFQVAFSYNSS